MEELKIFVFCLKKFGGQTVDSNKHRWINFHEFITNDLNIHEQNQPSKPSYERFFYRIIEYQNKYTVIEVLSFERSFHSWIPNINQHSYERSDW